MVTFSTLDISIPVREGNSLLCDRSPVRLWVDDLWFDVRNLHECKIGRLLECAVFIYENHSPSRLNWEGYYTFGG